ncbi:MAG: NUDIX domain-containing protein [Candidatus Curtissbacteria bacterium]
MKTSKRKEYWEKEATLVSYIKNKPVPEFLTVTAVKVYVIFDSKLLLINDKRGWDVPGGHVNDGEGLDFAVRREFREETGLELPSHKFIGYLFCKKERNNKNNQKYPKESAVALFCATLAIQNNVNIVKGREFKFLDFDQVGKIHHNWTKMKKEILEFALTKINE